MPQATGGGTQVTYDQGTFLALSIDGHSEAAPSSPMFGTDGDDGTLKVYSKPDLGIRKISPLAIILWWDTVQDIQDLTDELKVLTITYPNVAGGRATLSGECYIVARTFPRVQHNQPLLIQIIVQFVRKPTYAKGG